MRPDNWRDVRRILAVRLDNIGDVVMLEPALRTLRCALPDASVTLLASPAGSQAAPLLPWVDDVIVLRALWQDVSGAVGFDPDRESDLVAELRARHFDAALIFTSFSQSPYPPAYACYLAGIPIRAGQSKEFGGGVLSRWVKPLPDEAHQVDRNLRLMEDAGFDIAGRELCLQVPDEAQDAADTLLRETGVEPNVPFVALAPGASAAARRYDPARYALVARKLARLTGLPIVLVGSSREAELAKPILDEGHAHGVTSLIGRTTVPELAAVIRRSAVVIANDSASMHMADAFGRPMVILFSGTEHESQWEPRSAPHRLLRRPTPCAPCYSFHCPYGMECLDIPAEEVVEAALAMLSQIER